MANNVSCYVEFERMGEPRVRRLLAEGRLGDGKAKFAHHWLSEKERARNDASQAEHAALTRSAAEATREQADAARDANKIAKRANGIAISATIIAIAALAVSIMK